MTIEERVEVGTKILLRAMLIFLVLTFLYFVRDIVILVVMAILLTAALDGPVTSMSRYRIPRSLAVSVVYAVALCLLAGLFSLLVPPLSSQIQDLVVQSPQYTERIEVWLDDFRASSTRETNTTSEGVIFQNVQANLSSGFFSTTLGVFSGIASFFILFFLSFYMSLEERGIEKFLMSVVPEQYREYVIFLARRIQTKVGQWMFGQVILMFIIFGIYFIGLSMLGVPYALALALLGGAFEIVPYVGPWVAAIPAVLLGFSVSPVVGFGVAILYFVVQQVENHIITPQVMKRTVGLNPVAVIVALLIGAKLAGVLGIILAVPLAAIIGILVEDFLGQKQGQSNAQ